MREGMRTGLILVTTSKNCMNTPEEIYNLYANDNKERERLVEVNNIYRIFYSFELLWNFRNSVFDKLIGFTELLSDIQLMGFSYD